MTNDNLRGLPVVSPWDVLDAATRGEEWVTFGELKRAREQLATDLAAAIARAEALESALDHIARVGKSSRKQTQRTKWIVARAISALNGDDEWMSAMKPTGYHDALDRAAIAAQQAEGKDS